MNYILYKYTILIGILLASVLAGCKKEEKIVNQETNRQLNGNWLTKKIVYRESSNEQESVDIQFDDPKPAVFQNEYSNLPSQLNLQNDGTYWSISHTLRMYFATVGNLAVEPKPSYDGTYLVAGDGKKIVFDKGVYEFSGSSPRQFSIAVLKNDSLKLNTKEPKAIYDWAFQYARQVGISFAKSAMSVKDTCTNGAAFGNDYGMFLGYYDATKNFQIEISPFSIGRARGLVNGFNATYDSTVSPAFHQCFKSAIKNQYESNYQTGLNEPNVTNRQGLLQFEFSK